MVAVRHRQRAHRPAGECAFHGDEIHPVFRALGVPVASRELEAGLNRFGAAVAEKRARQPRQLRKARRRLRLERVVVEIGRVNQRCRLVGNCRDQARMRVAERGHTNARDEVQVFAAVDVVQARAAATDECDRLAFVGLKHVPRLEVADLVEGYLHFTTCVQPGPGVVAPASVSNATPRPLAITTSPTPRRSAARHASSFATIPLFAVPVLISWAAARDVSLAIVWPPASSTPAVPPAMIRRRAPSWIARCDASVSALTFRTCPSRVVPRHATTGT